MKNYRVDNIPVWFRLAYLLVSYVLGTTVFIYYLICHFTCRISYIGEEKLEDGKNKIFCIWHTNWWPYFAVFSRLKQPHVWINHPSAHMKPIHVTIYLTGVKKIILGSQGEEGRTAADKLVQCLRQGFSTVISPDGPSGPPGTLRKGVLHLALKSGAPIVPLSFMTSQCLQVKSWDSKRFPLPFSKIKVVVHDQILVEAANFAAAAERLKNALDSVAETL
jgi:lysophospholipid acyltransferase (LPLAT)-like uncharacterized protein